MREKPLAGYEVRLSIAVQIDEQRRVRLRPSGVDHVTRPLSIRALLEPEHTIVVRRCGNHIATPVAVDIDDVQETRPSHGRRTECYAGRCAALRALLLP